MISVFMKKLVKTPHMFRKYIPTFFICRELKFKGRESRLKYILVTLGYYTSIINSPKTCRYYTTNSQFPVEFIAGASSALCKSVFKLLMYRL